MKNIYLLLIGFNLLFSLFLLKKDPKKTDLHLYNLILVTVSGWMSGIFLMWYSPYAILGERVAVTCATGIAAAVLVFVLNYPKPLISKPSTYAKLLLLPAILGLLSPTDWIMQSVDPATKMITYGPLYPIWLLYFFTYILGSVGISLHGILTYTYLERLKLKYFSIGLALPAFFASTTNII